MAKEEAVVEKIPAWMDAEIKKKAEAGIQMDSSTPGKQQAYDRYQDRIVQLTKENALRGDRLHDPNDFKNKIWEETRQNATEKDPVYFENELIMDRNQKEDASKLSALEEMMKKWGESSLQSQNAILQQTRDAQLAEIQKALEDAVAEGKISVRDAQAQFEDGKKQIEKQAYQDKESTAVQAEGRGIGNSQQMIGLMQGDNARKNSMINENMSTRDKRINDITDRLNAIKNKSAIDSATANATFGYGSAAAQGNVDAQMMQNLFQMYQQNMQQDKNNQFQLDFGGKQNQWQNQQMDKQQKYTLEQFAEKYKIDLKLMDAQQRNQLEQMAKQFGYNIQTMDKQQSLTLEQFAVQQGYDLAKMSAQERITLNQMAVNQGYTITNMGVAHDQSKEILGLQQQFQASQSYLDRQQQITMFEKQSQAAQQGAIDEYASALEREYNKNFAEGSPEYKIQEKQKADALAKYKSELATSTKLQVELEQFKAGGVPKKPGAKPKLEDYKKWYKSSSFEKKAYEADLKIWNELNKNYNDWDKKYKSFMSTP